MVVNGNRDGPRDARQVAADHEDDAELTDGVREAQDQAGDHAFDRERQRDAQEGADARRAERRGRLAQGGIDLGKRRGDRLDGERQAVEHRGDDQGFERERQPMAGPVRPESADGAARPDGQQHIESQHRRRQDERERDDRLGEERPPAAGERQPIGKWQAHDEENRRDDSREPGAQPDSLPIHACNS